MKVERTLVQVGDRLARAREELRIVEEQLLFQIDVAEEAHTRALMSETPLADREYRMARDDLHRLESERSRLHLQISEIRDEQNKLLDRMLERSS
jgi:hypothetical protein